MEQPILYKYEPKNLNEFVHEEQSLKFIKAMIEMNNLNMLGGKFYEPRKLFNPDGDKDMIQIYKILKFDNNE